MYLYMFHSYARMFWRAWLSLPGDSGKFAAGVPSGKEDLPGLFLNNFFTLCLLEYKFMCMCYCVVHIKLNVHLWGRD